VIDQDGRVSVALKDVSEEVTSVRALESVKIQAHAPQLLAVLVVFVKMKKGNRLMVCSFFLCRLFNNEIASSRCFSQ